MPGLDKSLATITTPPTPLSCTFPTIPPNFATPTPGAEETNPTHPFCNNPNGPGSFRFSAHIQTSPVRTLRGVPTRIAARSPEGPATGGEGLNPGMRFWGRGGAGERERQGHPEKVRPPAPTPTAPAPCSASAATRTEGNQGGRASISNNPGELATVIAGRPPRTPPRRWAACQRDGQSPCGYRPCVISQSRTRGRSGKSPCTRKSRHRLRRRTGSRRLA